MKNFFYDRRIELDLTQVEIAEELGMTQAAVSSWECFVSAPSLRSSEKLSKCYRITRDAMEQEIVSLNRQIEKRNREGLAAAAK